VRSLIGNPVKVGSGPAAVTLLFLLFVVYKERTLLAVNATVSTNRDGKVAKRAGEPEDLPSQFAIVLRPLKNAQFCPDLKWGKNGCLAMVSLCERQRPGNTHKGAK